MGEQGVNKIAQELMGNYSLTIVDLVRFTPFFQTKLPF